jgi:hypothetical protein
MHEIRASIPPDCVPAAVRLASEAGIDRVAVSDIFVHGPDHPLKLVSVETSTPKAKVFVDAFLNSAALAKTHYTLTSRELRAIIDVDDLASLTQPLSEPFPDVIQDFWQGSHVNASYMARAAAGAALLATGIIEDNPVAIVVAALFLPFLSQVLTLSFGLWSRDLRLFRQGAKAVLVSIALALVAGAAVAAVDGGPIRFDGFKHPLASSAISALIGITAGLSAADDTGRRYLIGVAAAVQLAIYPVWFGAALVIGLPDAPELRLRLASFLVNFVTIAACAVIAYASLHLRLRGWKSPRSGRP